jgi:hypothetical protein
VALFGGKGTAEKGPAVNPPVLANGDIDNSPAQQRKNAEAFSKDWREKYTTRCKGAKEAEDLLVSKKKNLEFKAPPNATVAEAEKAQGAMRANVASIKSDIPVAKRAPKGRALGNAYVVNDAYLKYVLSTPEATSEADIVVMPFDDGITLTMGYKTDILPHDYNERVAGANANAHDSGEHSGLPMLMNIQGFSGMGQEPGYDYFPTIDRKNVRGAKLEWTDNDARYTLTTNDQTVPLSRLVEIANSMY